MPQDIFIEKIGGLSCEPISGFVVSEIRIAPVEWFTNIGKPKPMCDETPANEATTFKELAEITDDHTFVTDKGFMKLNALIESVGLVSTLIGNKQRRLFENKLNAILAGSGADLIGFARWAKNKGFIVLAPEAESGNIRQIGSLAIPATITEGEATIAPELEGDNAFNYTFGDKNVSPAPIYKGLVTDIVIP